MASIHLPDARKVKVFLAVAESLSFVKAAARLNLAQPAVSRTVKSLEDDLGFALLERTTRRVALTAGGVVFAKESAKAMQQLALAARSARQAADAESGTLTVGYSALTNLRQMADIVVRFRAVCPAAEVGLHLMASSEQVDALSTGAIDAGILLSAACADSFEHAPVGRQAFVALFPQRHRLAHRSKIALRELASFPFVLGTMTRWRSFRSIVDSSCLQAGFLPRVVEEADDNPVLLRLVSIGRGITIFGASIGDGLPAGVVAVPISDEQAYFELSLGWRKLAGIALLQRFVDHALACGIE